VEATLISKQIFYYHAIKRSKKPIFAIFYFIFVEVSFLPFLEWKKKVSVQLRKLFIERPLKSEKLIVGTVVCDRTLKYE